MTLAKIINVTSQPFPDILLNVRETNTPNRTPRIAVLLMVSTKIKKSRPGITAETILFLNILR